MTQIEEATRPRRVDDQANPRAALEAFAVAWRNARDMGTSSYDDDDRAAFLGPVRPYPGLRSFSAVEHALFHGRDHQIKEVRDRLAASGIIFVIGGSGTGKSSLVRAGLLPDVRATGALGNRSGRLYIAEFRPLTDARAQLLKAIQEQVLHRFAETGHLAALAKAFGLDGSAQDEPLRSSVHERFQDLVLSSSELAPVRPLSIAGLFSFATFILDKADALASPFRAGPPNLLLVIDQFEEIFASQADADQREEIIKLILRIHDERPAGLFLAVTMRSEALHRCSEWPGLSDVVNDSLYLLEFLDLKDAAREAIIEPAVAVSQNWRLAPADPVDDFVEERLVKHLLNSSRKLRDTAQHRPDHLPLLQHALQATWDEAAARWATAVDDNGPEPVACRVLLQDFQATLRGQAVGANELRTCLDAMADQALEEAKRGFEEKWRERGQDHTGPPRGVDAEGAIRIAFCAMAGTDDRGNRERRFATVAQVLSLLDAPPDRVEAPPDRVGACLVAGLGTFVRRGYLTLASDEYSVSHEALIRCWKRYGDWLQASDRARDGILLVARTLAAEQSRIPLEPYPSLRDGLHAWLKGRLEWWVSAREELAQRFVDLEKIKDLQLVFGEPRQFTRSWAIEVLARDLGSPRRADETGDAFAPNIEGCRHQASTYVSQIEAAIPLASAWWLGRARLRRKCLMPISAAAITLVLASGGAAWFYAPQLAEMRRQTEAQRLQNEAQENLFRVIAVANEAAAEGRDPVSSAYELNSSLFHWKRHSKPGESSTIVAERAIFEAARRIIGNKVYAELNIREESVGRRQLACSANEHSTLPPNDGVWASNLTDYLNQLPPTVVSCLSSDQRLLLVWERQNYPNVYKISWYCDTTSQRRCDWTAHIKQNISIVGFERTRENFKEEQDILFRIIDRLHSEVLNGHSGKAFSRLEFVSYNDGTAGFEFLDHDNNTSVRLSVVFGISDLEPYRAPTNLELCDPYRGKCSIDGIELSYDEKSREVIGILKNQHMFFQADNNWPRIHKIGVDKNYVWLLDSSGRYWRVVHGADRISEILGHRHKGQKDPKLTSTTCEKVVCTQWMN